MKKLFEYKSPSRDSIHRRRTRNTLDRSMESETRRKLFRQPKSCPLFSTHIDNNSSFSSEESSRRMYYWKMRPSVIDIDDLLESRVKECVGNDFIYLNYAVPKESEFFTPYSFREVSYANIDRHKYFTISRHGFTMWSKEECIFTELEEWTDEYRKYSLISKIKIFCKYRQWKIFRKWSKLIKRQKFLRDRKLLAANLFLAQPRLSQAIIEYRRASEVVQNIQFFQEDCDTVWILDDFVNRQKVAYEHFGEVISEFYKVVSESLDVAAVSMLKSKGFSIEECEANVSLMKFMDRLTKRKVLLLICRYLRYIDYMTTTLLFDLVLQGSHNFLEIIERCNGSSENHKTPALLSIKILLLDQKISISPSQDEVLKSLEDVIDQSLKVVKVKRFEENELFRKFTNPIIGGRRECLTKDKALLDIENYFLVDNRLSSNRSRIVSLVNDSFSSLHSYLDRFKSHLLLYSSDLLTNHGDLQQLSNVQELRRFCERYTVQMKDIKDIESLKNFGIFELDQRCFDEEMTPLYQRLYGRICVHLPFLVSQLLTETHDQCQEIMGTLLTPPEGTVGFVDYLHYLDHCEMIFMEITDKLSTVDELLELISMYEIEAGEDLWKRYRSVSEFLVNCKDAHSKKFHQKETFVEKLSNCIDKDVYQVYTEVTEIKTEISKDWILSEESQPVLVKETLSNALEQLQVASDQLVQLQAYCEHMDIELIDLSIFVEVQVEARVRLNLWESLEEWTNALQEWYTQNFYQLDIEEMRMVNQKILEHCMVFDGALPDNPISPKLRASVELFKGKIEIISQLRNETLRERHWTVIEELMDWKIVDNESITIKDFEEVGVFEERIARKLVEISAQARAEQELETQLSVIESFWMSFHLKLNNYRYHRNIFILTNIEEAAMHLDDAFVRINVIRSSEHVEPIRDRVEKWIIHLNVSTETLSEWSVCQTNWSRLEYLFSLPGIEFKIPEELKLFKVINGIWKETMCEVHDNSLALVALLCPGRLKTFQECNMKLTELSERMDNYLDTRRLNYPRLYFLSDFELMTILTEEPKNVQQVGRFLPKIFDSIFRLTVTRTDIECLLEPVYKITHMISETGQEVPLVDEVRIEGSADQWLKVLEMEMVNTVRRAIRNGFHSFDKEEIVEWGRDKLPQVMLVISRLKLFQEVEEYFESPQEEMEIMMDNLIKNVKEEMTFEGPNVKKGSALNSLLYTLVYYKDLINRIKSQTIDSFEFNQIWRYQWINESPVLSIDGHMFPYFHEFISRVEDFLFSSPSDRTFLHFQRTIKAGLSNLISGPQSVGKTSTIRMFAKLVAKFTITFECNEMNRNYSDFQRILFGIVQTGCWCILRSFDLLDKDILSVIGDQFMLIKEGKMERRQEIELTGKVIKFNIFNQFFLISNVVDNIPESLKIYLRDVVVQLPDRELLNGIKKSVNDGNRIPETVNLEHLLSKKLIVFIHGKGKTRKWKDYIDSYNGGHSDKLWFKQIFINSIPVEQLYGYYSKESGKWVEGFLEKTFHSFYKANPISGRLIIVLDGNVKDTWMNVIRGINERRRFVTLPNMSLLRIPERVSFVIETGDAPGMALEKQSMGAFEVKGDVTQEPRTYFQEILKKDMKLSSNFNDFEDLFDKYFPLLLISIKDSECFRQQSVHSRIKLLVYSFQELFIPGDSLEAITRMFIFVLLWILGGALTPLEKSTFEITFRKIIQSEILPEHSLWDVYYCRDSKSFLPFKDIITNQDINPLKISLDMPVPTIESTRMGFLFKLFGKNCPLIFLDPSLDQLQDITRAIEVYGQEVNVRMSQINFCHSKSTESVQRELERVLIPRRKQSIGPIIKSHHIYMIGDISQNGDKENMSEFLRQLIEIRGYYDRNTWNQIKLLDVSFVGVASELKDSMKRLTEQCLLIRPVMSSIDNLIGQWSPVIDRISSDLPSEVKEVLNGLLTVITKLYKELNERYPLKFSIFQMRRVIVGCLQTQDEPTFTNPERLIKLFHYELERVLIDSINSDKERLETQNLVTNVFHEVFLKSCANTESTIYVNFSSRNSSKRVYEEVTDIDKLSIILSEYLTTYNKEFGTNHQLFLHNPFLIHLSRICGLTRMPHFHGCVIGGVAKKVICKLAAFVNNYKLLEINGPSDIQSKVNDLIYKNTPDRYLLLLRNITHIDCLKPLVEILDNGYPSFLLDNANPSQSSFDTIKSRVNILLLYDTEELMIQALTPFPTLTRWCQRYYLPPWSHEEYQYIALKTFDRIELSPKESHHILSQLTIRIYQDFKAPRKFLHLMQLFEKLYKQQKSSLEDKLLRITTCKKKLSEIKEKMASEDLKKLLPQLEDRKSTIKEMRIRLEHMVTHCDSIRAQVVLDESSAKIQTASTAEITDDVNKDLEVAMPALRAAQDQIKSLSKGDWNELKGQNNPVKLVVFVHEAVCILFKLKPDWPTAKGLINDPNILTKILDFDKENVSEMVSKKIKAYIESKDFDPAKIEKVSKVSKCLCLWVKAIDQYAKVFKVVEPKVRKQQSAETALREAMTELRRKQQELADAESKIQILRDSIDEFNGSFKVLQENVDLINLRLTRANRVTTALAEEDLAWTEEITVMEGRLESLPTDVLFTCAAIVYLGCYQENARKRYLADWRIYSEEMDIKISEDFSLQKLLIDDLTIVNWQSLGLPKDAVSIDNALMWQNTLCYPLIVDNNERMAEWILNIEPNLRVLHHRQKDFEEHLKCCMKLGERVLIKEVADPVSDLLLQILQGTRMIKSGKWYLQTDSSDLPFETTFFLYLVTKRPQKEFSLDFLNNVNTIDCEVSETGNVEHILSALSGVELNAMRNQSLEVQSKIAEDCLRMKTLQNAIVSFLYESKDNILDNADLVAALYETKETYSIVVDRLADTRESEKVLVGIREKYRSIAVFGEKLLNLVNELRTLDPLYSIPMKSFVASFATSVQKLEGDNVAPEVNKKMIAEIVGNSIKVVFDMIKYCLRHEDQESFARRVIELLRDNEDIDIMGNSSIVEIEEHFSVSQFGKIDFQICIEGTSNPIIIVPREHSLEMLIAELRCLQVEMVNFIAAGEGNEEIVHRLLDESNEKGHVLVLQNVHFNRRIVRHVEEQFADEGSGGGNYKLVLIAGESHEIPKSILYNSCVLSYYGHK